MFEVSGLGFRAFWGQVPDATTSSRLSRFLLSSATAVMTLASLDNYCKGESGLRTRAFHHGLRSARSGSY